MVDDTHFTHKYDEMRKYYLSAIKCIIKLVYNQLVAIKDPTNDKATAYFNTYRIVPDPNAHFESFEVYEGHLVSDTFEKMEYEDLDF